MLFLYQNALGTYQVIDDNNSQETVLLESKDKATAVNAFNTEVANRKKTTLLSFDGAVVMDTILKREIK